jgi:hypothetical protein
VPERAGLGLPTEAKQRVALTQLTPVMFEVVFEVSADQDVPPLVVDTIVPLLPTAKQTVVLGQLTPTRSELVTEGNAVQLTPPSVDLMIMPPLATAKHSDVLGQLTPHRRLFAAAVEAAV